MANKALVGIVARAQAVGIGMELREYRIELAQADNRRAIRHICARIACRFQLAGAIDTFVEGRELIGRNGGAGGWVRADDRRMWNRNTPILKVAGGILQAASHSGICLREGGRRKEVHQSGDGGSCWDSA